MKLLILKENNLIENRVALTPDLVSKFSDIGFEVLVEKGAGANCGFSDDLYKAQNAKIIDNLNKILPDIDIIISVQRHDIDFSICKENLIFISILNPLINKEAVNKLNKIKINIFSLDLLPRITRAQSMDVLSSQSNLAGYRAVIDGVYEYQRAVPMMMTAAGTVSAAKFMIIGAGVAGLQAIATAKRLGGIVCAFDVRSSAKEQVKSLGAKFIEVNSEEKIDSVYAKEMSADYQKKQKELLIKNIANQDIVISTALIPGKKAPIIITKDMVKLMKPGSVIVDLAAINGGNCEMSKLDQITEFNNVKIIAHSNYPSRIASDCSKLYAKNIYNFIEFLFDKKLNKVNIDHDDEIIQKTLIKNIKSS